MPPQSPTERPSPRTARRAPRPLDRARLEELALAYVARFAVTAAKLEGYLARKLRERGWAEEGDGAGEDQPGSLVAELVARFVRAGYVDDAAYARAKAGSLLRRGYGARRIGQALGAAGIKAELREEVRAGEGAQRRAALAMSRKRGFGPFGASPPERDQREKQLAALLRAGHPLDFARELVNAPDVAAAEDWAAVPGDEDERADG